MRVLLCVFSLGFLVSAVLAQPAQAQAMLKNEPLYLAPYAVAFVDNGSCGVGKVLKVRGALGAMHRKKTCVPMGREAASLSSAIP